VTAGSRWSSTSLNVTILETQESSFSDTEIILHQVIVDFSWDQVIPHKLYLLYLAWPTLSKRVSLTLVDASLQDRSLVMVNNSGKKW
jgi:hypothetical protein